MNPYENSNTPSSKIALERTIYRRLGPMWIAAVLLLAVIVGALAQFDPSIRAITMPRFGWIGLISCLNPLIFLVPWLIAPKRLILIAAASMTFFLGINNGVQLLSTGTVDVVENEFTDRLHSSWLWSVLPFLISGLYLYWHSAVLGANPQKVETIPPIDASDSTEDPEL